MTNLARLKNQTEFTLLLIAYTVCFRIIEGAGEHRALIWMVYKHQFDIGYKNRNIKRLKNKTNIYLNITWESDTSFRIWYFNSVEAFEAKDRGCPQRLLRGRESWWGLKAMVQFETLQSLKFIFWRILKTLSRANWRCSLSSIASKSCFWKRGSLTKGIADVYDIKNGWGLHFPMISEEFIL